MAGTNKQRATRVANATSSPDRTRSCLRRIYLLIMIADPITSYLSDGQNGPATVGNVDIFYSALGWNTGTQVMHPRP